MTTYKIAQSVRDGERCYDFFEPSEAETLKYFLELNKDQIIGLFEVELSDERIATFSEVSDATRFQLVEALIYDGQVNVLDMPQ